MDKKRIRNSTIAGCFFMLLTADHAVASCGQQSPTITNLPATAVFQVNALSANGDLTGYFYSDTQSPHVFSYRAGQVIDLGTLGGEISEGFGINGHGEIAGDSQMSNGEFHALRSVGTNLFELGTLGGSYSSATVINDAGQVAGASYTANDATFNAFLYANGMMNDLGNFGGGYSSAYAINASGEVVGVSTLTNNDQHGFLYSGGTLIDVGTLGGTYCSAFAINDNGLVAGESSKTNGDTHAFIFKDGVLTDLGTLGGTTSSAYAVNKSGQVLGAASTANDASTHGFVYSTNGMIDLGTLGGPNTFPGTINNAGQIVGSSELGSGSMHAFLWENGNMVDLNAVTPAGSGWELSNALYINDAGRIVGTGTYNGIEQTFILDLSTPNQSPVAIAGPDVQAECGTLVTLDGSQSTDPDGNPLTYQWISGGSVLGTNNTFSAYYPAGTNVVTLFVSDACGANSQTNVTVTVVSTNPPTIVSLPTLPLFSANGNCEAAVPNITTQVVATTSCGDASDLTITQSPVAGSLVGLGQQVITVTVTDASGHSASGAVSMTVVDTTAPVILSAATSRIVSVGADCQGQVPNVLASILASDSCTPANQLILSQQPAAGTTLAKGAYVITVTVTDAAGNHTSQAIPLSLVDTTAPVIQTISVNPSVLSSPNHQIVPVTVSVTATDNCDSAPVSKIVSITANETVSAGDIQITGNLTANLAASRNPSGGGRIYTITVASKDASGNCSTRTVTVTVPQGNGKK